MIPIVIGGTPVSRFWVLGGVDAMMNGYPWVVQLKVPPHLTDPERNGPICGGTVINSRLAFLNFDIKKVALIFPLLYVCHRMSVVEYNKLRGSCHYFCFHKKDLN